MANRPPTIEEAQFLLSYEDEKQGLLCAVCGDSQRQKIKRSLAAVPRPVAPGNLRKNEVMKEKLTEYTTAEVEDMLPKSRARATALSEELEIRKEIETRKTSIRNSN